MRLARAGQVRAACLKRRAPAVSRYGHRKMDPSVLQRLRRKALMSR
jgi:hypothetical protein